MTNRLSAKRLQNIHTNRAILKHIINAVIYLGIQGLAFRGPNESEDSANRRNFLEMLAV